MFNFVDDMSIDMLIDRHIYKSKKIVSRENEVEV